MFDKPLFLLATTILMCAAATGQEVASSVVSTPEPPLLSIEEENRIAPGLILELRSAAASDEADGSLKDARRARLVGLRVGEQQEVSPFVDAGPFDAAWRGHLYSEIGGVVDFSLAGAGTARLDINATTVLESQGDKLSHQPTSVQLHAGFNLLNLTYQSPPQGESHIRLLWSSEDFLLEPVPPTVLFHDPLDPLLAERNRLRYGRELFAARSCAKCHGTDLNLDGTQMPELSKDNPDLKEVGARLRPTWLFQWLMDPHSLRSDVTMPAVSLGNEMSERRQAAADIVAFLVAQAGSRADDPTDSPSDGDLVEAGEALFEERSCLACHRFSAPAEADDFQRVSLRYVGAKYRTGALARFLQSPHEHYSWNRMLDMQLSETESQALAAYIRSGAVGKCDDATELSTADRVRGEQAYFRVGCANCHPLSDRGQPTRSAKLTGTMPAKGCLAPSVAGRAAAPDFSLSEDQRQALLSFDTGLFESLQRRVPIEISQRYVAALRCNACHDRDGEPNLLGDVLFDESVTGRPPEMVPHLTWVGEKLYRSWMEDMFAGRLQYRARPWMKLRMPLLPIRATDLAAGLAAEHGISPAEPQLPPHDPQRAEIGQQLTLQTPRGFFCIQCHAVGDQAAVGAFDHRGINFALVAQRLRYDYFKRWITDPLRMDPGSKMPKLAPNGKTTNIESVYEGDAQRQFGAIWQYLQSLNE